ncbi:STAS domain-containing protein [Streptomyces sp. NPDC018019]|uniref:STAS domain-containing protein n=1 Tax=Streptomyces sp. NPDC018019 TaxID=3365030 RepID=UPI0037905B5E
MAPAGEFDVATAPALREQLEQSDAASQIFLIADLSHVTFMDSSALTELETAQARNEADGGWLRLVYRQRAIGQLLRLTGLASRFPRYATVEDAWNNRPLSHTHLEAQLTAPSKPAP